jgi:hypothetical protein
MRKNFIFFFIGVYWCTTVHTCSGKGEARDDQPGEQKLGQGPQCGPRPDGQGPRHGLQKSAAIVIFTVFLLLFGLLNELCLGSCGRAVYVCEQQ